MNVYPSRRVFRKSPTLSCSKSANVGQDVSRSRTVSLNNKKSVKPVRLWYIFLQVVFREVAAALFSPRTYYWFVYIDGIWETHNTAIDTGQHNTPRLQACDRIYDTI
jgi:hypothetical protein